MDKAQRKAILNQAFSPTQPIQEKDFFFGRMNQLMKVIEAINEKGQHAILYGERGVGKTSLANIMYKSYTNIYPVKITCDRRHTFRSLWEDAFDKIQYSQTTSGIGFNAQNKSKMVSMKSLISSYTDLKTNQIVDILNNLGNDYKLMFIFDEFDNIDDLNTKYFFADLIKSLSDNNINTTVILVGIAESVEDLIGSHQSLERCLKQVKMPRMKKEECEEIIVNGLKLLDIKIDKSIQEKIIEFSSGFPHYIHLLCKYGCLELIENDKNYFSEPYLNIAINKGIENTSEQLRITFRAAILSSSNNGKWKNILYACANSELDEFNSFTISDIVKEYNKITQKASNNSNLHYCINELTKKNRAEILTKLGKGRSSRYTFKNPMMRAFIKLKMNAK
ncbi:nSTAND1 domain-containing NTPase [Macellibacteroides fermentans]|uniref:Cdc6-like AAA superfamily ATPase n=1 Tax=Macellibacteroides fermentans TaxID=879969 RepID=A0A8E1ZX14_9PORP|nr:AAA family ATPase [Macellibacteroides fermentans]NYI49969.1 Cdc6-like AAA superfamily ATPase [Macellibacteroides fermentans]